MKLSDAIEAGTQYAQREVHTGGYWKFTQAYSLDATRIGADPLFAAFLGRYQGGGLVRVVSALKGQRHAANAVSEGLSPTTVACFLVIDGLNRAFRHLGETCSDDLWTAAEKAQAPVPGKSESLWLYLCRLNDESRWSRAEIVDLLRAADL